MPVAAELPRLKARGLDLSTEPDKFGFLRRTTEFSHDGEALRTRMEEDGYLYLPGFLNRDEVVTSRLAVLERAEAEGMLDPAYPRMEGILKEKVNPYFRPDFTRNNPALLTLLYDGPMMALFESFFGGPVRHFDYTWLRAVGPGPGTSPHCDVVYMGRGTPNLYTAWTPLGDISLTVGGLMVLENSHRRTPEVMKDYLSQDVDTYCENGPNVEKVKAGQMNWEHWDGSFGNWDGSITHDPVALREQLGGRWLTSEEYRMGDLLVFSMRTIHASIDNQTHCLRLSTDTRYQLADEPVDERWIGENPIAHGLAGKRGKIC